MNVNQIDITARPMQNRGPALDAGAEEVDVALLESYPAAEVVTVPVAMLLLGESPRLDGHDSAHVARLCEIDSPLPPIVVERRTLRVIDGTHRLMAAIMRGDTVIEVRFFDGRPEDAFLHAVHANVVHGFPLSQADRRSAATRILTTHPHMSDRAIAEVAGLGAKTVAAIRRRSGSLIGQPAARIGRDGRVRPVNATEGRQRVVEMISRYPQASLRELARSAGVSPATASDVRRRLERGEAPAPTRPERKVSGSVSLLMGRAERVAKAAQHVDPAVVLEKLVRDPSLRHKEEGRQLLRLLQQNAIGMAQWPSLLAVIPPHCGQLVAQLAQQYARLWTEFAQEAAEQIQAVA